MFFSARVRFRCGKKKILKPNLRGQSRLLSLFEKRLNARVTYLNGSDHPCEGSPVLRVREVVSCRLFLLLCLLNCRWTPATIMI